MTPVTLPTAKMPVEVTVYPRPADNYVRHWHYLYRLPSRYEGDRDNDWRPQTCRPRFWARLFFRFMRLAYAGGFVTKIEDWLVVPAPDLGRTHVRVYDAAGNHVMSGMDYVLPRRYRPRKVAERYAEFGVTVKDDGDQLVLLDSPGGVCVPHRRP